jgi:hypothetical protein
MTDIDNNHLFLFPIYLHFQLLSIFRTTYQQVMTCEMDIQEQIVTFTCIKYKAKIQSIPLLIC